MSLLPVNAQCGGLNYQGPTICGTSLSCEIKNVYYSQCLNAGFGFDPRDGSVRALAEIARENARLAEEGPPVKAQVISKIASSPQAPIPVISRIESSPPVRRPDPVLPAVPAAIDLPSKAAESPITETTETFDSNPTTTINPPEITNPPAEVLNETPTPATIDPSLMKGALIGCSIGLLICTILISFLFMRFKRRKIASEIVTVRTPEESFMSL